MKETILKYLNRELQHAKLSLERANLIANYPAENILNIHNKIKMFDCLIQIVEDYYRRKQP